jgi:peptidyl-lysine (3S)-dioxygenase / protease
MKSRYADAIIPDIDGKPYFVEPHISQMTMAELLDKLAANGVQVMDYTGRYL